MSLMVLAQQCGAIEYNEVLLAFSTSTRSSYHTRLNEIRNVRLFKNCILVSETPMFYMPPTSRTIVDSTTAEDNIGSLFYLDQASIGVFNSLFTRNFAFQSGVIFAVDFEVSISASFDANRCEQIGSFVTSLNMNNLSFSSASFINRNAYGSVILLIDPRNAEISNCVFEANVAEHGSED